MASGSECGIDEYLTLVGDEPYYACTAYVPPQLLDRGVRGGLRRQPRDPSAGRRQVEAAVAAPRNS